MQRVTLGRNSLFRCALDDSESSCTWLRCTSDAVVMGRGP